MPKQAACAILVLAALAALLPEAAPARKPKPHDVLHAAAAPKPPLLNAAGADTATADNGPSPIPDSPAGDATTPTPPQLPGMTAFVLMDGATGAVLAEAAPALQVAPASLTKLMTAHLTYQALHHGSLKLDQTVPVSVDAWHAGGSRMFIDPTSVVTVDQLLHGLIIDSGNDAAVALAEQVAGSTDAFVTLMNNEASQLNLTNTNYTNVTGLPDPQLHTSAMDVALLTRVILQDEPEILNISKIQSYTYDNITQASWNPVLEHDPTVDGLKTGLTEASGHCIDATAVRNNMRLIAVVMGGPTWRASTAAVESLLNYGEKFFTDVTIAAQGKAIGALVSPALQTGSVAAGAASTVVLTMPDDTAGQLLTSIVYSADPTRGIHKGDTIGTAYVSLGTKSVAEVPVVALTDASEASFWVQLQRKIQRMI